MRSFSLGFGVDTTRWEAELGVDYYYASIQSDLVMWVGFFFPFNAEKMVRAEEREREKEKHRGGQRGCLIVFGLYAVFFDWPRNCPADSNLIRHPQIKHGSSSSKQKRSNTALPNKQSALYFHLFLSFILFFIFFSLLLGHLKWEPFGRTFCQSEGNVRS